MCYMFKGFPERSMNKTGGVLADNTPSQLPRYCIINVNVAEFIN